MKFFRTSIQEISEIIDQTQREVQENHVNRIRRLAQTAYELNIDWGRTWHTDPWDSENEYGDPSFLIVEKMYSQSRDMAVDMMDLGNLVDRLRDFVGKRTIENPGAPDTSTVEASSTPDQFITTTWLPDDFYGKLIEEINLTHTTRQLPIALTVLVRKLFENLVIDILRKKYGTSDLDLYYDASRRKFQEFSVLLKNLDKKQADFHYVSPTLDSKLIADINKFRETGNSAVHSLDANIVISDFDKAHINYLVQFLLRLLQNI